MLVAFSPVRVANGFASTRDDAKGRLPGLIAAAGFAESRRPVQGFSTLELLSAVRPRTEVA